MHTRQGGQEHRFSVGYGAGRVTRTQNEGPRLECDRDGNAVFTRDKSSYRELRTCRNCPKRPPSAPPFIAQGSQALALLLYLF